MPQLHNKYHRTAPPDAVYIGRPSKWGNPYSHMDGTLAEFKVATREEAVAKYEAWLLQNAELMSAARVELAGKDLVCYCAPKSCHGNVLLRVANDKSI